MQFGSDVDDTTKATLDSGRILTDSLKQGRYAPVADELQSVLIYAVSEGYAKNIDVEDMERFEKELYSFFETEKAAVLLKVKNSKKLDDALRQELDKALAEFAERF
jgi:F-type H+-transporting ATPase subunit alpha